MYCAKCGSKVGEDAVFCGKCGNRINAIFSNGHGISNNDIGLATNNQQLNQSTNSQETKVQIKHEGFWRFMYCDYLYILIYAGVMLCATLASAQEAGNFGRLIIISLVFILPVLIPIISWRSSNNKAAYIFTVISLFIWGIVGFLALFAFLMKV